jgi:hypothetical protein
MVNFPLTLAVSTWSGTVNSRSEVYIQSRGWGLFAALEAAGQLTRSALALPACPSASEFMNFEHQAQAFAGVRSHYLSWVFNRTEADRIRMSQWAGAIGNGRGNHGGQKARPTPGGAQESGALVLEEPSYSSWDTALEQRATGSHSLRCIHGHWTMNFRSSSLSVDPDGSVKAR